MLHAEKLPSPGRSSIAIKRISCAYAFVLFALTAAACGETEAPGPPLAGDPDAADTLPADTAEVGPAVGWSARSPVRVAPELGDEGTTLILFEATEDFPVRFSTYFPEVLGVELIRSGEGVAVRFAGEPQEVGARVVLLAYFPTDEVASEDMRGWIREVAEGRGTTDVRRVDPPQRGWADLEYEFRASDADPPVAGTVSLGRQDDQYFYVIIQTPMDRGDDVEGWVEPILSTWEWEDGTPLVTDAEPQTE